MNFSFSCQAGLRADVHNNNNTSSTADSVFRFLANAFFRQHEFRALTWNGNSILNSYTNAACAENKYGKKNIEVNSILISLVIYLP